jgi:hypothetical protein
MMQGSAEKVDTVPASERLVSHTFLYGIDPGPGSRIGPCQADTFSAVAQAREAFIGNALIRRAAIRAGMAESAMRHIPAMQKRTGGQGAVPGEWRESTGGTFVIDQLEELLGELLRLCRYWRRSVWSCQRTVLCWDQGRILAVRYAV